MYWTEEEEKEERVGPHNGPKYTCPGVELNHAPVESVNLPLPSDRKFIAYV